MIDGVDASSGKSFMFFFWCGRLVVLHPPGAPCCVVIMIITAYEQHTWPNLQGDALAPRVDVRELKSVCVCFCFVLMLFASSVGLNWLQYACLNR
jgi:hypothetical protein